MDGVVMFYFEACLLTFKHFWKVQGTDPVAKKCTIDLARGFTFSSVKSDGFRGAIAKSTKLFDFLSSDFFFQQTAEVNN
jgi:hypothetical protein